MRLRIASVLGVLAMAAVVAGPSPTLTQTAGASSASAEQPVTLIQAGWLLDRPGQAPRGPSTLVVRDGRIVEVRDGFVGAEAFPGAVVTDLRDRYVLPGLIDTHTHLVTDLGGDARLLSSLTDSLPMHAYRAADNARITLMTGFTTVRNLGDLGMNGVVLALRDATATHRLPGPRILDAAASISATSGHTDRRLGLDDGVRDHIDASNVCNDVASCREAVRIQVGRGADVIKMAITGGVNSRVGAGLNAQMFEDEAKAVIDTAHMYGLKVAVHAHGTDGVNMALRLGADSIEHGTMFDDETLRLFQRTGAYYVPTLSTVNGYLERLAANPNAYPPDVLEKVMWRIDITGRSLERAVPAGVRIAFGTDSGVSKHGRNLDEFGFLVRHGMTPMGAIQAATVNAADLLGLADEVGALEPGRRADVVALRADPLADISAMNTVSFVMRDGRIYRHDR